jgi:protein TonB
MLAYAANRPDPAGRHSSPNVMLFIVAVHIAAIAALMSAKMDVVRRIVDSPTTIYFAPPPPPPPPPPPTDSPTKQPQRTQPNEWVSHPHTQVQTQPTKQPAVDLGGTTSGDPGPILGPFTDPVPQQPMPLPLPVRVGPALLTPASALRPPYPESKLLNEEEADLRLKLTISPDGRVTAVDPIGRADSVFLDAARRYLMGHWHYRPATVDGRAVATTIVITLSFRLDD